MCETQENQTHDGHLCSMGTSLRLSKDWYRTGKIDEEYLYPFNGEKYWNGGWLLPVAVRD